ncbi:MAG TPA: class I SAM-dependent methyltransferase [Bryobacteraceae bacterium]|nr:class I SAM-dependent methyltransferase [Bryobacteraceae bacterium]
MPAEVDNYASSYEQLLHDPIREIFALGSAFFFERDWMLIAEYLERIGLQVSNLDWLDVGCGRGELLRLGQPQCRTVTGCDVSAEMLAACGGLRAKLYARFYQIEALSKVPLGGQYAVMGRTAPRP